MERAHPSIVTDGVAAEDQTLAAGNPFWVFFVLNTGIAPWLSGVVVAGMGLDAVQAIAVIVVGSLIGAALPAATALAGPASGLSQLEAGRAALGATGNRLPALCNWIGAIGWDVIFNSLSAAALVALSARFGHEMPMWAAFAVLVAVQLVIGIWGHHLIQITAHWTGLVLGLAFVGLGGAALARTGLPAAGAGGAGVGEVFAALLLVVSFSITLAPYASDYTRYLPRRTPGARVFGSVFGGLALGSILFMGFGWATAALVGEPSPMGVMGALADLSGPLAPAVLAIVAVNSVPCNAVNDNSAAYCLISAGIRLPRPVAAAIGAAIGFVVCLAASDDFVAFFENFLFLFAHGIAPWAAILIVHHAMRGARAATPHGIAAGTMIFVAVTAASVLLFSANSLWTGLLSPAIGGADIGPYVGFVVAGALEATWLALRRDAGAARG